MHVEVVMASSKPRSETALISVTEATLIACTFPSRFPYNSL
jgi:hypothetical protein